MQNKDDNVSINQPVRLDRSIKELIKTKKYIKLLLITTPADNCVTYIVYQSKSALNLIIERKKKTATDHLGFEVLDYKIDSFVFSRMDFDTIKKALYKTKTINIRTEEF